MSEPTNAAINRPSQQENALSTPDNTARADARPEVQGFVASGRRMTRGEFYAMGHDDGSYLQDGSAPPDHERLTVYGRHAYVVYEEVRRPGVIRYHTAVGNAGYEGASADEVAAKLYDDYVATTGSTD